MMGAKRVTGALSAAEEAQAKALWMEGEESAAAIGALLGVSKNTVFGLVHRRGWGARGNARILTLFDRMDALEAAFNKVRDECAAGHQRHHYASP